MDKLKTMTGPLGAAWGRMSPVQKAVATVVPLLALVALMAAISVASRPQYDVLFSNLETSDAGAIVQKLKEAGVPYKLTAGGTAVQVPSKDVYEMRLKLASDGLPQGGSVGFEIFDKSNFGMTEFTQKLNYQRALQGELARTIGDLAPIEQARVHVAIPEQSVYSDRQSQPTASVVVKLRPSGTLDQDQVSAITHLVSAAVEGLKPDSVAVVDTAGNLLSDGGSGPVSTQGLRLSATQLQMQNDYEARTAKDLQAMLEKVLGPGKAIVRVSARLNFDAKQTESTIYEPIAGDHGVMVSQEQQQEDYSGASRSMPAPALTGLPGSPEGAVTRTNGAGDRYTRTQNSTRYEVTKRVEHTVQAPGHVDRLSVAVLVDGSVTPEVTDSINQAVSAAAGLDPSRGDQVTVESLPFDTSAAQAQDREMAQATAREARFTYIKWGATVLLALGFLFFLRSVLASWRPVEVTEHYPRPLPLQEAEALTGGELDLRSDEPAGERPAAPAEPARIPARRPIDAAREDPEGVARLLRTWLTEAE